jgi:hypothetical protein
MEKADRQPTLLMISGHPRSGTTLLNRLCNSHPDISMTFELKVFNNLNMPYGRHLRRIRHQWWDQRIVMRGRRRSRRRRKLDSFIFMLKYAFWLRVATHGKVTIESVRFALDRAMPHHKYVGDKFPSYNFNLSKHIQHDDMKYLVIYRDCRRVVKSVFNRDWHGVNLVRFADARATSQSWVQDIETMERYEDKVHTVRYEALLDNPQQVLEELGEYLDVDPQGFNAKLIKKDKSARNQRELTDEEIEQILEVAGPTLERLGYL